MAARQALQRNGGRLKLALYDCLSGRQNVALLRVRQGLIEVGYDVVAVLDSNAEPDHLWRDSRLSLLLWRHLPMGRRESQR